MTDNQPTVDAIRESWITEERVRITFRSPEGEGFTRDFSWPDIEDGEIRIWKRRGFTPISREIVYTRVGTTPESENHTGGFHE